MPQALFVVEARAVKQLIGRVRRMPVIVIVDIEVILDGDAEDARIVDRRAIGQFARADTDYDVVVAIVRPDAEQRYVQIAVIALALAPDDDGGPGCAANVLGAAAEDSFVLALRQFGERVICVQKALRCPIEICLN